MLQRTRTRECWICASHPRHQYKAEQEQSRRDERRESASKAYRSLEGSHRSLGNPLDRFSDTLGVAALGAAAFSGPIHKALHLRAVFPGQMEKFAGIEPCCFRPKKGLEAPTNIWAIPRCQAVTSCRNPVVSQCIEHDSQTAIPPHFFSGALSASHGRREVLMNEQPTRAALFPDPRIPDICFYSLTIFCFLGEMHRNRRPSKRSVTLHFKVLARR